VSPVTVECGDWVESFVIPRFSRSCIEDISKGIIKKRTRIEIVHTLAQVIWSNTNYPSSSEYTLVCKRLVEAYPVFKDAIGNGIGSWKIQLRQRLSNMRRPSKNDTTGDTSQQCSGEDQDAVGSIIYDQNSYQEQSYDENLQLLQSELGKSSVLRNKQSIKLLMESTFTERHRWIIDDMPLVYQVLDLFPPLKEVKYLMAELKNVVLKNDLLTCQDSENLFTNATDNFSNLVKTLKIHAEIEQTNSSSLMTLLEKQTVELEYLKSEFESDNLEDDERYIITKQLHALEILESFITPKSSKKSSIVLIVNEPFSDLKDVVQRENRNHPYLVVVSNQKIYLVVERIVLGKTRSFTKALWGLIGAYFTFNISYPKPYYNVLIFIQHLVLMIRDKQPVPPIVTRVFSALQQRIEK
jgi:hypothetical protein